MPSLSFLRSLRRTAALVLISIGLISAPALAADTPRLPVEAFELENGMRFLLVRRTGAPLVTAGWAVRVGSGDEQAGSTGISHLLEHLMFHGSRRIGTRFADREGEIMARQDEVADRLFDLRRQPASPERDTEIASLQKRMEKLLADHQPLMMRGEFSRLYKEAGAVGTNAITDRDHTIYYGQIPANKLELWFWMESDRLLDPVFREYYNEGRIVEEERRQRMETTPEGIAVEKLNAAHWEGHPYAWPPLGRMEDLATFRRSHLAAHFAAHYRPDRMSAVLVGDFDPEQVKALARAYFGRLPRRETPASAAATAEPAAPVRTSELRITERCACTPQARVLYHTPPFGHPDTYALDVLTGVLNGRTGRLYRSLVLEQGTAFAAFALHEPGRRGGTFGVVLESKGSAAPGALVSAWDAELERLRREPVSERELQKVKNQILTEAWRQLSDPVSLAIRLLTWDARGDWRFVDRWPEATQAVTAADLQRVLAAHFAPKRRTVGIFERR